jgi:hypothetical protein
MAGGRGLRGSIIGAVVALAATTGAAQATSLVYSFQTVDIQGASATNVQGVNNSGVAAGSFFGGGISQGFFRAPDGTTTTFTIDGLSTGVGGINNLGQIAGNAGTSLGFIRNPDGSFVTFAAPGAVLGINNAGDVVGYISAQGNSVVTGYLRAPDGTITPINDPSGSRTVAQGINDLGQIVGNFNSQTQGFLRNTDGSFSNFTVPSAHVQTAAQAINNLGDVGGFFDIVSNQGFVRFADGTFETVDDPLGSITEVLGMNDLEDLAGYYFDPSGVEHGFLATPEPDPVPEPEMAGFLLMLVMAMRRVVPHRPRASNRIVR